MKGFTMLTVVITALVQQEEMVTVITSLYYMCLNSLNSQELECAQLKGMNPNSYNAYKAYNVISPYYREKFSGRNCSQATYFPK